MCNMEPGEANEDRDFIEEIETNEDFYWLLENSPIFRNYMFGNAAKLFFKNQELLKADIQRQRQKREKSETQT